MKLLGNGPLVLSCHRLMRRAKHLGWGQCEMQQVERPGLPGAVVLTGQFPCPSRPTACTPVPVPFLEPRM